MMSIRMRSLLKKPTKVIPPPGRINKNSYSLVQLNRFIFNVDKVHFSTTTEQSYRDELKEDKPKFDIFAEYSDSSEGEELIWTRSDIQKHLALDTLQRENEKLFKIVQFVLNQMNQPPSVQVSHLFTSLINHCLLHEGKRFDEEHAIFFYQTLVNKTRTLGYSSPPLDTEKYILLLQSCVKSGAFKLCTLILRDTFEFTAAAREEGSQRFPIEEWVNCALFLYSLKGEPIELDYTGTEEAQAQSKAEKVQIEGRSYDIISLSFIFERVINVSDSSERVVLNPSILSKLFYQMVMNWRREYLLEVQKKEITDYLIPYMNWWISQDMNVESSTSTTSNVELLWFVEMLHLLGQPSEVTHQWFTNLKKFVTIVDGVEQEKTRKNETNSNTVPITEEQQLILTLMINASQQVQNLIQHYTKLSHYQSKRNTSKLGSHHSFSPSSTSSITPYSILCEELNTACHQTLLNLLKHLQEAFDSKLIPTDKMFIVLIRRATSIAHIQEALQLMKSLKVDLTAHTCCALIRTFGHLGNKEAAWRVYERMKKSPHSEHLPDLMTFTTVINQFKDNESVVNSICNDMYKLKIFPDIRLAQLLIKCSSRYRTWLYDQICVHYNELIDAAGAQKIEKRGLCNQLAQRLFSSSESTSNSSNNDQQEATMNEPQDVSPPSLMEEEMDQQQRQQQEQEQEQATRTAEEQDEEDLLKPITHLLLQRLKKDNEMTKYHTIRSLLL